MIEIEKLTKVYLPSKGLKRLFSKSPVADPLTALDDVSLKIGAGEFFGLLGSNGAGKTTLLKILCTLLLPTEGRASVGGFDVVRREDRVKRLIGLVPSEEKSFYWRLSGRQNLAFFGRLLGLTAGRLRNRIDEVLETVGLASAGDNMVYTYSSGMRQKLSLARGLLGEPDVLFLDEPMKAVDPMAAVQIRETLKELVKGAGKTVVMSTHRLADAEAICDRLAIMDKGRAIFTGTPEELGAAVPQTERYTMAVDGIALSAASELLAAVPAADIEYEPAANGSAGITLSFNLSDGGGSVGAIIEHIEGRGGRVSSFSLTKLSIEELFIRMINGGVCGQTASFPDKRLQYTA